MSATRLDDGSKAPIRHQTSALGDLARTDCCLVFGRDPDTDEQRWESCADHARVVRVSQNPVGCTTCESTDGMTLAGTSGAARQGVVAHHGLGRLPRRAHAA